MAASPTICLFGDFPDSAGALYLQRGVMTGRNLGTAPAAMDQTKILEWVSKSWYTYTGGDVGLHPSAGQTTVNYTGPTPPYTSNLSANSKYSYRKTPRYNGRRWKSARWPAWRSPTLPATPA